MGTSVLQLWVLGVLSGCLAQISPSSPSMSLLPESTLAMPSSPPPGSAQELFSSLPPGSVPSMVSSLPSGSAPPMFSSLPPGSTPPLYSSLPSGSAHEMLSSLPPGSAQALFSSLPPGSVPSMFSSLPPGSTPPLYSSLPSGSASPMFSSLPPGSSHPTGFTQTPYLPASLASGFSQAKFTVSPSGTLAPHTVSPTASMMSTIHMTSNTSETMFTTTSTPVSYCWQDEQCTSIKFPVCDIYNSWRCVPRACNANGICQTNLLMCDIPNGICVPSKNCTVDSQCTVVNTACAKGFCDCKMGYRELNGECTVVVGQVCADDIDCNVPHVKCSAESKCVCMDGWYDDGSHICKNLNGHACSTWTDCGQVSNLTCNANGKCACGAGFKLDNGVCTEARWTSCKADSDCGIQNMYCLRWGVDVPGYCDCGNGTTYSNHTCKVVLGSSCSDVICGNASHWSYGNDWYMYYYYSSVHAAFYCNIYDVCSCASGYRMTSDKRTCEPVYGAVCQTNSSCSNSVDATGKYVCKNGHCNCSAQYIPVNEMINMFDYNYWSSLGSIKCESKLGQSCINVSGCGENAVCDIHSNNCTCREGYFEEDGKCLPVLGAACTRDEACLIMVPNSYCTSTNGFKGVCSCQEGYKVNGSLCIPVHGQSCTSPTNCSSLVHGTCNISSASCSCSSPYLAMDGRCLSPACAMKVRPLPDLYRRSRLYSTSWNEPAVGDSVIMEGWYSIGKHMMSSLADNLKIGNCGSYFPIYLQSALTSTQIVQMATENVSALAIVANTTEQLTVKFRKCNNDTQVYLQQPKTKFAGYCIETGVSSNNIGQSSGRWAVVAQLLTFVQENMTYTPRLMFECEILDKKHPYRDSVYNMNYNIYNSNTYYADDGHFYTVHWFVNKEHFATFGPVRRPQLHQTSLHEGDFEMGSTLQCVYQWSETLFGDRSAPVTSAEESTGAVSFYRVLNASNNFLQVSQKTPIGCTTEINDNETLTCALKWKLLLNGANSNCTMSQNGGLPHEMCGVTLYGISKTQLDMHGGSTMAAYMSIYNNYTYVDNVTKHIKTGVNVQLDLAQTYSSEMIFTAKFAPLANKTVGHYFDLYTLPDLKFVYNPLAYNQPDRNCSVIMKDMPVVRKYFENKYVDITLDVVGEFLIFKSNLAPVEVQAKTEKCSMAKDGICLCAITYRSGDSIGTYDYCGGAKRVGTIFGPGFENNDQNLWPNSIRFVNGMAGTVSVGNLSSILASLISAGSQEAFEDGGGMCIFEPGNYRKPNGAVSETSLGFAAAWLIKSEESLLNSVNHKTFTYQEDNYLCACPANSVTFPDSKITNISQFEEGVLIYNGVISCNLDNPCPKQNDGEGYLEWDGFQFPNYTLTDITMISDYIYNSNNLTKARFHCKFDGIDGVLYKIQWTANNITILESDYLTANQTLDYYLYDSDIQQKQPKLKAAGITSLLEAQYSCGVSVYYSKNETLLPVMFSDPISAIAFDATELIMARGGDVSITFTLFIPLLCNLGEMCTLDFKVYDPHDGHECNDSTIAIKNKYTCGERIFGASNISDIDMSTPQNYTIVLTTKNNYKYSLRNRFSLKIKTSISSNGPTWWNGELFQTFTVFVRDDERYWQTSYCYVNNDPRLRTFDGQYYSIQNVNEYIMMKHKKLPVEIQMQTESCNGGLASCSCGITIRAGRDVFTITHCNGDHISKFLMQEDNILSVYQRHENRYQIYLPHGTMVDVQVSWWRWYLLNVNIYPSPADKGQVEGLCGNCNGRWDDDLIHKDGSHTPSAEYYWQWSSPNPDSFSDSWRVSDSESFLNLENISNSLEPWKKDEQLCVCMDYENSDGDVMCSGNEDDTCKITVDKPGTKLTNTQRNKRSVIDRDDEIWARLRQMRSNRVASSRIVKRSVDNNTGITFDEAIVLCQKALNSSCGVFKVNDDGLNRSMEERGRDCAKDSMLNKSVDWSSLTCTNLQADVEVFLARDVDFKASNSDIVKQIETELCIGNCNNHGTCINKTCICHTGYGLSDCSISKSAEVKILGVQGNGLCNIRTSTCKCIWFTTSGSTTDASCKIEHKIMVSDGNWTSTGTYTVAAMFEGFNDICCPVTSSRRRRSPSAGSVANQYLVAMSNDGSTFGTQQAVYVLDSMCLNHNSTTNAITLTPGYCIIEGTCYQSNNGTYSQNPSDSCWYCNYNVDPYAWTKVNTSGSCNEEKGDDKLRGYIIAIIVLCVLVAVCLVAGLLYKFVIMKYLMRKKISDSRSLFDNPKNTAFALRREITTLKSVEFPDYRTESSVIPDPEKQPLPSNLYDNFESRDQILNAPDPLPSLPEDVETKEEFYEHSTSFVPEKSMLSVAELENEHSLTPTDTMLP